MARIDTDLVAILNAIVARLQSQVTLPDGATALNDSTCFLWIDDGEPPAPAAADMWLTVEADGGDFDEALFKGGGENQLTEHTHVNVTIYSTQMLDPAHRAKEFLQNSTGIMPMAKKVLKALAGHDLVVSGSDVALRELIRPRGRTTPHRDSDQKRGSMTIQFALSYDWNLS